MFEFSGVMKRIAVGKLVGFIIGLLGFFLLPYIYPETSSMLKWGVLFWYTTFGAIIAAFGVFTYHPVLKISMPWWFRGPFIGAWLNLVLTFFAYQQFEQIMLAVFGEGGVMQSPFWFVLEGAIFGWLIDYLATKCGGEGEATVA